MAAESARPTGDSAESYIGSFISLISKSEIRYEGFLFHINYQESAIGLRNVKSFGTEGRRKDGPQILPNDKVYEYIFFRGSDIKDLQVISSPPAHSTSAVPNDPAIIQSHYPHPTSAPPNMASGCAAQLTNFGNNMQYPISTFQGNLPQFQSVRNSGSLVPFPPPPTMNNQGLATPSYWQGATVSSGEISHLQQQSLPPPPPPPGGLMASPFQQKMQHPNVNASLVGGGLSSEVSLPFLPPISTDSFNSTSGFPPPPTFLSNLSMRLSSIVASNSSPNPIPNNGSGALPSATLDSNSPLLSSLPDSSNVTAAVPPTLEKTESILGPASRNQNMPQLKTSIVGTTSASLHEVSVSSLVTTGQILQPGHTTPLFPLSVQSVHENNEVMQPSTSEPLSPDSENCWPLAQQSPFSSAKEVNGDAFPFHQRNNHRTQGRGNRLIGADIHTHRSYRGHAWRTGNGPHGAALRAHHSYRSYSAGRENGLIGADLHPHQGYRGHPQGRGNWASGAILRTPPHNWGYGRRRRTKESPRATKFADDFDFEAMNEKFNKQEVWGLLARTNKAETDDEGKDENESNEYDSQDEAGDELRKFDMKPIYRKDDFFDSFSCDRLGYESGREKMKFTEQMRKDTETFGKFLRHRHRGLSWPGRAGGSCGSYRGRGYGWSRGPTVRSRVT